MTTLRWLRKESPRLTRSTMIELLQEAVKQYPRQTELCCQLAKLLWQEERFDELAKHVSLTREPRSEQQHPVLSHYAGLLAQVNGDWETAKAWYEHAIDNGLDGTAANLSHVYLERRYMDQAERAARHALAHNPRDFSAGSALGEVLTRRRDYDELWNKGLELLAERAIMAPSMLAYGARSSERRRLVHELVSPLEQIMSSIIPLDKSALTELALTISAIFLDKPLPKRKATVGSARRLDQLQNQNHQSIIMFLNCLKSEIEARVQKDFNSKVRSFRNWFARLNATVELEAWAIEVVEDGHEDWHVHPSGIYSGSCYLAIPSPLESIDGAIEFGPMPFSENEKAPAWPSRIHHPSVGEILIFPSYVAHRTWPTRSPQARLCVAFDIVDKDISKTCQSSNSHDFCIADTSLIRQEKKVVETSKGDSRFILNIDTGRCIELDEVGTWIWRYLTEEIPYSRLVAEVAADYGIDVNDISDQVENFIHQLCTRGFATVN